MDKQTPLSIWNQLNSRQQKYLELIYQADQSAERFEKMSWNNGRRSRPASVWRWLYYGDIDDRPSPLKSRLLRAELVDNGTGSTLNALERRTLIECDGSVPELYIKVTRLGRKAVRTGTNESVVKAPRTPRGMLSYKAWQAMVLVFKAGKEGVQHDGYSKYTEGIHMYTWRHLEQLAPPLIQGYSCSRFTAFGFIYYSRHYEQYRETYPDIDTPESRLTIDDIINKLRAFRMQTLVQLVQMKRGVKGIQEAADEIGTPVSFAALSQFEDGQTIKLEQLEKIIDWLVQ
ncbi:hypothetical protein [Acaryochloris marina]|uniref:hypothetical protein n=1 Tax=Acaryochloris marina TaxID=155978 RepID=UPI0021C2613F|nr:hypothetical protein [Acaryochloris marina]BDM83543.1 hypothetical protein AM10699_64040 [Acaryochloris marina MBIC10699]